MSDMPIRLFAAPFTPMRKDGAINPGMVPEYAAWLRENRVYGVFVNGSTGEWPSLTVGERKIMAQAWREHAGGLRVFVHVGHHSLPDARQLAEHASAIGADAIGLIAPSFFKPALPELVALCAEVAACDPSMPFYYYHIPSLTGISLPMIDFLREASDRIAGLAGIKFTFEDLTDFKACVSFADRRYDLLFGRDECLLDGLAAGAAGAIGSTYNYIAPVYLSLAAAWQSGNSEQARRFQARSRTLVDILEESPHGTACGKAIMPLLAGIDCGPCRLPLPAFSREQLDWLRRRVGQWQAAGG